MGVSLIVEEEVAKILGVLVEMRKQMGMKEDLELEKMNQGIDTVYLERTITEQLRRANKPLVGKLLRDLSGTIGSSTDRKS